MTDSEAKRRWVKENTIMLGIKLNRNTDADIIEKLEETYNRQGYIKQLIRDDIYNIKRDDSSEALVFD